MSFFATEISFYRCPFGALPAEILLRPPKSVKGLNFPAAVVDDANFIENVLPFITCSSIMNPITAGLTAAALGILTPGACIPLFSKWKPGAITILTYGKIQLTMGAKTDCSFGKGSVTLFFVPAMTIMTP